MAKVTKKDKIDYIFRNFTFKARMTKKKLAEFPESALDKLLISNGINIEDVKETKYMVDVVESNGETYGYDSFFRDEKHAKSVLEVNGTKITKIVKAKSNHRCMYCKNIAYGTMKNILCDDCRSIFGHTFYDEL